jgi:MutS-like protein
MLDPHSEYTQRRDARRTDAARLARRERRISNARLIVFAAGVAIAWLAVDAKLLSPAWLLVPFGVFVVLIFVHDTVIRMRQRQERAAAFYDRGLARLEDRWIGTGETGERFLDAQHPYAADLDLFGKGSVFELLSTARTRAGEETLARWLCAPATPMIIRERQAAVSELQPRLDLREELSVLGADVRTGVEAEALVAWGVAPRVVDVVWTRRAAVGLVTLVIVTFGAWTLAGAGPLPFLAAVTIEGFFGLWLRHRVLQIIHAVERPSRDLALLSELLGRLESERFGAPRLIELRTALDVEGEPPSRQIASLRRRVDLLDARRNQLFAPLAALLLWGTQAALAIEAWRQRSGPAVGRWLAALGELEALSAIAGYSYERPHDSVPEIVDTGNYFDGVGLGHPLIPEGRCVRNDLCLDSTLRLLVVSGSNMSGKSTLLRTVGVSAVLALAGAPVCATRLRLSPLAIGASLRIVDSLQTGTSHFYAEVKRLRQLVDVASGPLPLLFLLDEILHGTNSHDRRIGAEAVVRELVQRGALGLVTTHDLALARIVDTLAPHAANVHFEDHLEDGKMVFDYRMHPGVVTKSNALALMRAVGLKV